MTEKKKKEDSDVAVVYQKEPVFDYSCSNQKCGVKWFPDQPKCPMCGSTKCNRVELPEKVTAYTPLQFLIKFSPLLRKMGFEVQFYSPANLSADSIMCAKQP